jgi:hypothetical protein
LDDLLSQVIDRLPDSVSAIKKDSDGFGVIWDESTGVPDLVEIFNGLMLLKQHYQK